MTRDTGHRDAEQLMDMQIVDFQHEPEYVVGAPVYVAVTVKPRLEGSFFLLPRADFLQLGGCIGVRLRPAGDGGREVSFLPAAPVADAEEPLGDTFDLAAGEMRRMLIDLSPLLPTHPEPGAYDLSVSYVTAGGSAESSVARVTFRAPTGAEAAELARLAPGRGYYSSWAEWVADGPDDPATLDPRVGPDNPLRFVVILRYLLHTPEPLDNVDEAILAPLTGLYEPEAQALRAELLRVRNDQTGLRQQLQQLATQYPALSWWARSIADGDGELSWRRSH